MNYAIAGGAGFVAGVTLSAIFLRGAVEEVKSLVGEAHSKLDILIAAVKAKV